MYYIDFLVGISIGLGIGVLLTIMWLKYNQDITLKDYDKPNNNLKQTNNIGFFEVSTNQTLQDHSLSNPFEKEDYKKRLEKFQDRNRLYK